MDLLSDELAVFEEYTGLELVRAMVEDIFPGRIALVSSFGTESAVLLDMISQVNANLPVIFLTTGKLFQETLNYRRRLEIKLGLENIIEVRPSAEDIEHHDPDGALWARDADGCCQVRKVRPLERALAPYDAWITGRKRYHGGLRSALSKVERIDGKIKINPLADWSLGDVETWFQRRNLPRHPLALEGYRSVGCVHCTRKTQPWEGIRDGRWAGREKTECGIHKAPWARGSGEPS